VPVLVTAQLLAVPGRQQQRVVRPGAKDQYVQDARALRVHGQAGVHGQQVDQRLGAGQRHARRDHRQQPEHRTAVGDQQQHNDDGQGTEQQRAVDSLEGLGRVGRRAQRAGDVDSQARPVGLGHAANRISGRAGGIPAILAQVDRDDRLDRLPVLGEERA
jgi:hypothetical protein